MFIRNIVTDVIAILKHPQFRPAAGLCRYAFPCLCWHQPVATTLDHQQRLLYLLHHTLQVESLQLVECLLLVGGFEPVNQRIAAYLRTPLEVFSLVVGPTVFDRRLDPLFKCGGTYNELSAKTHTHQTYPSRIHVWSALKVIDGVLDRNFVVKAQWELEFHLSLTWAINGQHRHPSPQKVVAINVQFFLHRIQSRDEYHHGWPGSVPRLAQDAGHCRASLVADSYTFASKVEKR